MHGEALQFDWNRTSYPLPVTGSKAYAGTPPSGDPDGLRVYQRAAVTRIFECLAVGRSTLLVMPTGDGKTQTFGAVVKHWRGRVLVLAHRSELLEQARDRLSKMTGEPIGLEQADYWAAGERIVVGSVSTLGTKRQGRLDRFAHRPFGLVVIDEAHHSPARSYVKILEAFPESKVLGVTATPDRGDEVALGKIFETVAYRRDYLDAVADGYLVPVSALTVEIGEVNLSRVKTTAGDLNIGQLDAEMQKGNERIAAKTMDLAEGRKTIVFTTGVETAHMLAETFNRRAGQRIAAAVDGKTPVDTRRAILREHARGEFQYLINVGIATEGYDCPEVSCVAIARPTKSRALYAQMAGRGSRVLPGLVDHLGEADARRAAVASSGKPDMLLIDFVGQAGRHSLISPIDILGGRLDDPEVARRAAGLIRKKAMRPDEAVAQAKQQAESDRARRAAAIQAVEAEVTAEARSFDPFGGRPLFDEEGRPFWPASAVPAVHTPLSPGLRSVLEKYGFHKNALDTMDQAAGVRRLRHEIARKKAGLASNRQQQFLGRYGVDASRMYRKTASALFEAIKANNWRALPREQYDAIVGTSRAVGAEG